MTDPEYTPEANYKYRVRRLGVSDNQPNEWISVGKPSDFDYYASAAMKAILDSLWFSDSVLIVEDIVMYPVSIYVNGMQSYNWRDAPEASTPEAE